MQKVIFVFWGKCGNLNLKNPSSAYCAMVAVTPLMTTDTVKLIYFACFHFSVYYLWGNSAGRKKVHVFSRKLLG